MTTFRQELILSLLKQSGGELSLQELSKLCRCSEQKVLDEVLEIKGLCYRNGKVFIAHDDWKDWLLTIAFPLAIILTIYNYPI